jgi:hypothetical protein
MPTLLVFCVLAVLSRLVCLVGILVVVALGVALESMRSGVGRAP